MKTLTALFLFSLPLIASAARPSVPAHTPVETTFIASTDHSWRDFPITATFTQGERRIETDAFWDGGRTWRIRFAPPTPGTWTWTLQTSDPKLKNQTGEIHASAPTPEQLTANPNLRGQVQPAAHHFTYADGTPVLLLGDCLLLNEIRTDNGDFIKLLDHRRAAGFNALNVRLCKHSAGNEGGKAFGGTEKGIDRLNPAYFQWIDKQMQAAWQRGFTVFFMPDFLGFGPYTEQDVHHLWRFLLARYAAYNICPILTGEYDNPRRVVKDWKSLDRWNATAAKVHQLIQRSQPVPLGAHPYAMSSGQAFHDQPWLAYNQIQAKVWERFDMVPIAILEDRARTPAKPTFYAEGTYENQPWAGITGGPHHIRHQTWVSLLCGAAALDYGEHLLKGGQLKDKPIQHYLDMPGAKQAALAADHLRSHDWWRMAPQRESILLNGQVPELKEHHHRTHTAYALGHDTTRLIYLMSGLEKETLTLTRLVQKTWTAQWLDPRTGETTALQSPIQPDPQGHCQLPPRPAPADEDWVLILKVSTP